VDATTMRATLTHDAALTDFLRAIAPVRSRILQLILFGSRARQDHRTDSDYDLLVLVPGKDPALLDVLYDGVMDVLLAHGRVVSLKVLDEREYERLRALGTPFMKRIAEEGVGVG
jgi:predicted nucleotidyltransferase